jgi:oligopeptide/dipeptide ABC transporter ATP-binding protein
LLEVSALRVTFPRSGGSHSAVSGIDYSLRSGQTLGVVGESGSGKTMAALALMGLVPEPGRVEGSVRFEGRELIGLNAREWPTLRGARIAMVFQEPMNALNPVATVGHQIAEVLVLHKRMRWREAKDRAVGLLEAVGISAPRERARAYPHQLSGGMRQRVMIAMALACEPRLLIADEPTTSLDVTIQAQILELMMDLQDRIGMAILFISHNLAVVSEVADEIVVMYNGCIVERAPAAALFAAPRHPYTQGLLATLPSPDPHSNDRSFRLPVIPGRPLDPDQHMTGCRFVDRCPLADGQCHLSAPSVREVCPGHRVACFKAAA